MRESPQIEPIFQAANLQTLVIGNQGVFYHQFRRNFWPRVRSLNASFHKKKTEKSVRDWHTPSWYRRRAQIWLQTTSKLLGGYYVWDLTFSCHTYSNTSPAAGFHTFVMISNPGLL